MKILDDETVNWIAAEGPLSVNEIAEVLETTQNAVTKVVNRAIRKLKKNERFKALLATEAVPGHRPTMFDVKTVTKVRVSVGR
jgi:predicted DNA-binding protein YlxM (UPF0122 family)